MMFWFNIIIGCEDGYFRCDETKCLENSRKCDRYPDCNDKSDEMNCRKFFKSQIFDIWRSTRQNCMTTFLLE